MKKKSFFIGATVLAVGGVLAKILGAFYKIPLTHILGANGMGVYYLVFPFYSLALIISSSGLSVAVTKLVAQARSKFHRKTEQKILKIAILYSIILSTILLILTIILAKSFSYLQGNANAYYSYLAIAPAIVFASILSVIKGYFQGVENMLPSSISLLIEQTGRLVFGLLFAYSLMDRGLQYAVLGATLGVSLSELIAMIYLVIKYAVYKRKDFYNFFESRKVEGKERTTLLKSKCVELNRGKLHNKKLMKRCKCGECKYYVSNVDISTTKDISKRLIKYAIPSTLASLIAPLTVFVDSFLVINLLTNSGYTTTIATSLYGMSNGIVSSLISLPIVIISALSTTIVPNLSSSIELNSNDTVVTKTNFFIKFAWIIALPMFLLFLLFAPEIIDLLYSGGLSTKVLDEFAFSYRILAVSSVTIIYNAFLYTFIAILNAFDKPQIPFYVQCVALVIRTMLTFVLVSIPSLNVFGLLIANTVFLIISCIGCIVKIKDLVPIKVNIRSYLVAPIVSIAVAGLIGYGIKKLTMTILPPWLLMLTVGGVIVFMYIVLLLSLKVFSVKEWAYLPIPKKLIKFLPKKIREKINLIPTE